MVGENIGSEDSQKNVVPDDTALFVDDADTVAVGVVGKTDIGAGFNGFRRKTGSNSFFGRIRSTDRERWLNVAMFFDNGMTKTAEETGDD